MAGGSTGLSEKLQDRQVYVKEVLVVDEWYAGRPS